MLKEPLFNFDHLEQNNSPIQLTDHVQLNDVNNTADYHAWYQKQQQILKIYHEASQSGIGVTQMHTQFTDQLLQHLFQNLKHVFLKKHHLKWLYPTCLIALEEYGLAELPPHGTLDLLLLYPDKIQSDLLNLFLNIFNDEVIIPLWNLKITISHTCQTIEHALADSKKDFKTKQSYLTSRLICGSSSLFQSFQEQYENLIKQDPADEFENQCLLHKKQRHQKYNFTLFLREPDINTGLGGLQDYQSILYLAQKQLKTSTIDGIEQKGLLTHAETSQLKNAYDFLLRVKNELQFQTGQPSNCLKFENQSQIALKLGYQHWNAFTRIKQFMHAYYENTQIIYDTSELFERHLQQYKENNKSYLKTLLKKNFKTLKQFSNNKIDGFIVHNNLLSYESDNVFIENPIRLIRVFRHAQLHNLEIDHKLQILIKNSVHLIDEKIIQHPSSNLAFVSILKTTGNVFPILSLMHKLHVLQNFLPEFKNITQLVQQEPHHLYTVDIHTLNAIQILDEIFQQNHHHKTKRYYSSIHATTHPWLLYLILLLQNLGKSEDPADYPNKGLSLAKSILDRFNLNSLQKECSLFMLKNSLKMTHFAQRLESEGPQILSTFALSVSDYELLHYLYVQTYCSTSSISPGYWNDYKEMIHTKLFEKTHAFFIKNHNFLDQPLKHKQNPHLAYIRKFNLNSNDAQKILKLYPSHYFILNNPQEFNLHIKLLEEAHKKINTVPSQTPSMPLIHWEYDVNQSLTIVTIITWNHLKLLTILPGAFAACGLNIVESKMFIRNDQVHINTFHVMPSPKNNASNAQLHTHFKENLQHMLTNNSKRLSSIEKKIKNYQKKSPPPSTPLINIHHNPSEKITVAEIQCPDQIGLLYQLTQTLLKQPFNIISSKATLQNQKAIISFHLYNPNTLNFANDLAPLRNNIHNTLYTKKRLFKTLLKTLYLGIETKLPAS